MTKQALTLALVSFHLVSIPGWISAQEADPAPAEKPADEPEWSGSVGLSLLATGGNTDSETLGLDLEAERRPEPWGLEFTAKIDRAEVEGETTVERYHASVRGTRALNERWHAFAGLSAEKDDFADIDLRAIAEAGAVYKALLGPRLLPPEVDDSWLGGLAVASYDFAISDNATFSQELKYNAHFEDMGDWRLDSLTALTASLNQHLALKFSYEIRYRNEPVGDNDDTDTPAKASLVFHL